jgi:hypothetical protein
MNLEKFEFKTITDYSDELLTKFRQDIFEKDLQISIAEMSVNESHKWWVDKYNEDAFKYSDKKWFDVQFDAIEVSITDDKVVSMSGAKIYSDTDGNKFLRVNMFYYILKEYRKKCNGIIYVDGGFDDRHIKFAKENNCKGLFFTIYAYSSKLQALVINHTSRRISNVRSKLKHLDSISHVGKHVLNGVEQEFFYYPLSNQDFNLSKLLL